MYPRLDSTFLPDKDSTSLPPTIRPTFRRLKCFSKNAIAIGHRCQALEPLRKPLSHKPDFSLWTDRMLVPVPVMASD
jgi:hypothetical protein